MRETKVVMSLTWFTKGQRDEAVLDIGQQFCVFQENNSLK